MSRVRDCVKLAKETKVNDRYCMTVEDTNKFYEAYRNDPWSLIFESFKFGYAQGRKAERRQSDGKSKEN